MFGLVVYFGMRFAEGERSGLAEPLEAADVQAGEKKKRQGNHR